ncbi:MAG: hypothetical protein ABI577_11915 [bacterium]
MKRPVLALLMPVVALAIVAGFAAVRLQDDSGGKTSADSSAAEADAQSPGGAPRLAPQGNVCQGILHRPDPGGPRIFAPEYTQKREANGLAIVGNANVDPRALDEAAATVERFFRSNNLEEPLAADGAYVIVLDSKQGVLDLPEFKCMDNASNQAFFSHVCGVADRADYPVVTVGEEDLLGSRSGPCAGLNILYHEIGHLVQGWTMGPADFVDVHLFYQDALSAGKYRRDYANTNADEYFAEATQAYFLSSDAEGEHDRAWLKDYDPQIYEMVARLYGD